MIDALLAGKLFGKATERTGQSGKPFVTCNVRLATEGGHAIFAGVIAFAEGPRTALLALADGDSVALSGSLTPKTYTDREGKVRPALDVVAHAVVTAYHVNRRRKAMLEEPLTYV
jgi:hypothetical protein